MPVVELKEVGLDDPLPSWRPSGAKSAILDLIDAVTAAGSPDFVPPASRIAVFDHDGTLWAERPLPFLRPGRRRPIRGPCLTVRPNWLSGGTAALPRHMPTPER